MAWTQADVDKLKQAISDRGLTRSVTFSDRTVVFDSVDDMLKLLSVMTNEVNTNPGFRVATSRKGT